ncbi:2-oxoglutarate-dependent dioxygenase DAO, partial [Mucuna pruriens]
MHSSPHAVQDFSSQLNLSPHQEQIIEAYGQAIHDLASSVSQKMTESLDIEDADFKDWSFIFRIIKYNFTPEVIGSIGAQVHLDIGFITLLQDDETVNGLQLMDDSRSFKEVPPKLGSFLCIIGNVGHVWSNGKFLNVRHHVLYKEAITCYSFGVFMLASRDGNVEAQQSWLNLIMHDTIAHLNMKI